MRLSDLAMYHGLHYWILAIFLLGWTSHFVGSIQGSKGACCGESWTMVLGGWILELLFSQLLYLIPLNEAWKRFLLVSTVERAFMCIFEYLVLHLYLIVKWFRVEHGNIFLLEGQWAGMEHSPLDFQHYLQSSCFWMLQLLVVRLCKPLVPVIINLMRNPAIF